MPPPLAPTRGMPEAINLTFIAGPADRQSTQGIDSDSAAAENRLEAEVKAKGLTVHSWNF